MRSFLTIALSIWTTLCLYVLRRLVQLRYLFMAGRNEVGGMRVIVCRGIGTWGPRACSNGRK